MMNTLLAPTASGLFCYFLKSYLVKEYRDGERSYDLECIPSKIGSLTNGMLAGLVGVTAVCDAAEPWAALLIGLFAGLVYCMACKLLIHLKVDDPLEAF